MGRKISQFRYKKKKGTSGIRGHFYETKILMSVLLESLHNENVENFYMGTNFSDVECFDDVIYTYNRKGEGTPKIVCIQAKHKDDDTNLTLTDKALKKDGKFSLIKYFDGYLTIIDKFNTDSMDDIFKYPYKDVNCYFIIFTSAKAKYGRKLKKEPTEQPDYLIRTFKDGTIFSVQYNSDEIDNLVNNVSESRLKLLAESLIKLTTTDEVNNKMMEDRLIKRYHIDLAQKVLKISHEVIQGNSSNYREGRFRDSFLHSEQRLLSSFREMLYQEIVKMEHKKLLREPAKISALLKEILNDPSADAISKLIGSVLAYKNEKLNFIAEEISDERSQLKDELQKLEVKNETVTEAKRIKMKSFPLKLVENFGNLIFKIKSEECLPVLVKRFIDILSLNEPENDHVININDMTEWTEILQDGVINIYGDVPSLVGNVLIVDEQNNMLKFNDGESLADDGKQFLDLLKSQIPKEKDLYDYRFKINIECFPMNSFDNIVYAKDLANDFLSKLRFYTEQPTENNIETYLTEEIGKLYKATNSNKLHFNIKKEVFFLKIHDDVQKWWMQDEEALYLTDSCDFFKLAETSIIDNPLLTTLNFMYFLRIKSKDVEFSDNAISALELDDFVAECNVRILNIINNHTVLSSVKLIKYFKNRFKYTFLDFNEILLNDDYQKTIISELKETELSVVIIECEVRNNNFEEIFLKLKNFLCNIAIKIVVVSDKIIGAKIKTSFPQKYIEKIDEKNSLIDLTQDFQNLLCARKVLFQSEEVCLGTLVDNKLKNLIDGDMLCKLIKQEKLDFGKRFTNSNNENVEDFYIDRILTHNLVLHNEFISHTGFPDEDKLKEKGFIVVFNSGSEEIEEGTENILLVSNSQEDFNKLCSNFSLCNVHWFKTLGIGYVWQRSNNNLNKLFPFLGSPKERNYTPIRSLKSKKIEDVDTQGMNFIEETSKYSHKPETITDIEDKFVIIAAEPGMGKSTFLTHLSDKTKQTYPSSCVLRINLVDYCSVFAKWQDNKIKIDEIETLRFLYRCIHFQAFNKVEKRTEKNKFIDGILQLVTIKNGNAEMVFNNACIKKIDGIALLELELFNNLYNQGTFILLFDGFDEITPCYLDEVIQMLKILKNFKLQKLWITTRTYDILLTKLISTFNTLPYRLKPLSPGDQMYLLQTFWINNSERLDLRYSEKAKELVEKLFYKLQNVFKPFADGKNMFMSMPLHLFITAEIFRDIFSKAWDLQDTSDDNYEPPLIGENWNLFTFYERFTEFMFNKIRFGDKMSISHEDSEKPDFKTTKKEKFRCFMEQHKKLAAYCIYIGKDSSNCSEFSQPWKEQLFSEQELGEIRHLMDGICEGNEKTGIVDGIVNGVPRFIHRSCAEYFAVEFFCDFLKSSSFLESNCSFLFYEILGSLNDYKNIRRFIEYKLTLDNDLKNLSRNENHKKKIFKQIFLPESLFSSEYQSMDVISGERLQNPLFVSLKESNLNIAMFLLETMKGNLNNDNLYQILKIISNENLFGFLNKSEYVKVFDLLLKCIINANHQMFIEFVENDIGFHLLKYEISRNSEFILDILCKNIDDPRQIKQILEICKPSPQQIVVTNKRLKKKN